MSKFWGVIDAQLEALKTATTAARVVEILGGRSEYASGDAFFGGGGGDVLPDEPLREAGWRFVQMEADYYWCMRAPNGDLITYVEGDIYLGNTMRKED